MTKRYKPSEQPKGWAVPKPKSKAKAKPSGGGVVHEVTMGGTVGPSSSGGGGHEVTMGGTVRPPAASKPKKKRKIVRSALGQSSHLDAAKKRAAKTKAFENSARGKAEAADTNAKLDAIFNAQSQQNQDAARDAARSTKTHKYQTIRGEAPAMHMSKQPKDPEIDN